MGGAKLMMEEHDSKIAFASRLAIRAGTLTICEIHEQVLEGTGDLEAAYKLGNTEFSAGSLDGKFESRREMTDYIKEAVEENNSDECVACAKYRDE